MSSLVSRAEVSLVEALGKYRQSKGKHGSNGSVSTASSTMPGKSSTIQSTNASVSKYEESTKREGIDDTQQQRQESRPPYPPPLQRRPLEEDIAAVKALESGVPTYDKDRTFPGLAQQKITKKDNHMKALDDFAKLLDRIAENLELDVLQVSREMRERVENIDASLSDWYKTLADTSFLVGQREIDLIHLLDDLKVIVNGRSNVLETFAESLDLLEVKRAETVGTELKLLVDRLIAIAHQLPNEIEKIVESETFDLNLVLTSNRKSHAQLMGVLRKRHVEVEVETLQRWENGRELWRQLRHQKGLADFDKHINSDEFQNPDDRQQYMSSVREGQIERHEKRLQLVSVLGGMTSAKIALDDVLSVQQKFTAISEQEIASIQDCYNGMQELRTRLRFDAEKRVEMLRKELHLYGALHKEPDLASIRDALQQALDNPDLTELFRLGGGLKTDFQSLCIDLCCEEIVYQRHMEGIQERLELIVTGFGLKGILEERGRLMQLDKVRNLITKLRGVSKSDVPGVLHSILPELEEIFGVESVPALFRKTVGGIIGEMNAELDRIKAYSLENGGANASTMGGTVGTGTAKAQTTGKATRGTSKATAGRRSSSVATTGKGKSGKNITIEADSRMFIDPSLVKQWNKKLGILYYCSDLPESTQQACVDGVAMAIQQIECNRLVDIAVSDACTKPLRRMDVGYKKLIDAIATFMETQANYVSVTVTNIVEFFLQVAKLVEAHRKLQNDLDEKCADELWDLSEDFRIEREDREIVFEKACDTIRSSLNYDDLQANFEVVLSILEQIQESYRTYHGKACFCADKYPLILADELKNYLFSVSKIFSSVPDDKHSLLVTFDFLYDETVRLNKKFFDVDPNALGGIQSRSKSGDLKASKKDEVDTGNADNVEDDVENKGENEPTPPPVAVLSDESYVSPNSNSFEAYGGTLSLMIPFNTFLSRFFEEKEEKEKSAEEENEGEGDLRMTFDSLAPIEIETDPSMPWIRKDSNVTIISEQELLDMNPIDKIDYEDSLLAAFVSLDGKETVLESLSEDQRQQYQFCSETVARVKKQREDESDPTYVRNHPPIRGTTVIPPPPPGPFAFFEPPPPPPEVRIDYWVLPLEVTMEDVRRIITGIRESLVDALEKEAYLRITNAQQVALNNKDNLTEELEDRLRTHWPRRGRVETQIKQPREAELLGHEEKTWRYIQSIQQKMVDLQKKFFQILGEARGSCDTYINDISSLRNSLSGDFKNLAALQGIDVRARRLTIDFNASNASYVSSLKRVYEVDAVQVISYAMDFRKVCPPQSPGVEGGYSESEIAEIEGLVLGQCDEIRSITNEWAETVGQLEEQQQQSLKSQDEFSSKYEKCAQDLAMSEGLGQKYGAPRRRAQERLRTEVSRDEQSAGRLDEMLAKIEFICSEVEARSKEEDARKALAASDDEVKDNSDENGRQQLDSLNELWSLMCRIRVAFQQRAVYLRVCDKNIDTTSIPWLTVERIPQESQVTDSLGDIDNNVGADATLEGNVSKMGLEDCVNEVDAVCRKETKELYESEGKGDALGAGGIPEALRLWLVEAREKLLGEGGYRERAWKRLWAQAERFDIVVSRRAPPAKDGSGTSAEDDEEADEDVQEKEDRSTTPSALVPAKKNFGCPSVNIMFITHAMTLFAKTNRKNLEDAFLKKIRAWEKKRDEHERLLRPRLGSPEAAEELAALDGMELARSKDFTDSVTLFRLELVKKMLDLSKDFLEDVSTCTRALLNYLDSTLRQDMLNLPPDTVVTVKRPTLKRLRKAQRLRNAVAAGAEDRSKERMWPPVPLFRLEELAIVFESILQPKDPNKTESAALTVEVPPTKGAPPAKKGAAPTPSAPIAASGPPPLINPEWMESIRKSSSMRAGVSSAHRAVIKTRDDCIEQYMITLTIALEEIKEKYGSLLSGEKSWLERWARQVGTLRSGNL